jgi:hypothetical protein
VQRARDWRWSSARYYESDGQHHDHVVTVHAVEDQYRPPLLVMEFIQGRTLQPKIEQEGELELKQILPIVAGRKEAALRHRSRVGSSIGLSLRSQEDKNF